MDGRPRGAHRPGRGRPRGRRPADGRRRAARRARAVAGARRRAPVPGRPPTVRPGGSWKAHVDAGHVRAWRMLLDDAVGPGGGTAHRVTPAASTPRTPRATAGSGRTWPATRPTPSCTASRSPSASRSAASTATTTTSPPSGTTRWSPPGADAGRRPRADRPAHGGRAAPPQGRGAGPEEAGPLADPGRAAARRGPGRRRGAGRPGRPPSGSTPASTCCESWGLDVAWWARTRAAPTSGSATSPPTTPPAPTTSCAAWCDPEVQAVFCARGGYGVQRMVDLLDWESLAAAGPKVLVGFSDVTALHQAFAARLGAVHHPRPGGDQSRRRRRGVPGTPARDAVRAGGGHVAHRGAHGHAGRRVGRPGCWSAATSRCWPPRSAPGTRCAAAESIAVLEDVGEETYRLDRLLTQLLRSGWFDRVRGIVVGDVHRLRASRRRSGTWWPTGSRRSACRC